MSDAETKDRGENPFAPPNVRTTTPSGTATLEAARTAIENTIKAIRSGLIVFAALWSLYASTNFVFSSEYQVITSPPLPLTLSLGFVAIYVLLAMIAKHYPIPSAIVGILVYGGVIIYVGTTHYAGGFLLLQLIGCTTCHFEILRLRRRTAA